MIKKYIARIVENGKQEDMYTLGEMFADVMHDLKQYDYDEYKEYKCELYEMAYGKVISEEMAEEWVKSMKPVGLHWTMEDTTNAMRSLGYNLNNIDFFVVANMMYNDYFDLVKDNEELALQLAYDWLKDTDAKDGKLYHYWKHVIKRD